MPKVSVTVITRNEAANIAGALESVAWADEIIVVDSESTDDTVAIARRFTDKVIVRPWPGYVAQKNFAAAQAAPRLDPVARRRRARVAGARRRDSRAAEPEPRAAGYRIPRVTFHLGRWIRSTDWYPDYQLRLYDRRRAEWAGRYVHESVTADGAGRTAARASCSTTRIAISSHHLQTMDRYTTLAARADVRRRPARRLVRRADPRRGSRSFATTSCAAGFATACRD